MNIETNPERLLNQLAAIAHHAGSAILEWYDTDMGITHKADDSPLTKADLASHEVIAAALGEDFGEVPLLSEESAAIPWETRREWRQYWLVDPLDGTKEFISRNGEFTVNIALIRDHRPVLGVVHVPVTGTTFLGAVGTGAWCNREGGATSTITVRRPAKAPAVIIGSRSHANPGLASRLKMLGPHELTSMGSSLKFCRIAEGLADFYPRMGPTCEWDTAAAQAVVEAAGGQVVTADGAPLQYNRKEDYLNPHFFVFGDPGVDWLAPFAQ
jgi:3'(2'), 5'-bisphosphate nucleotidase